MGRRPHSSVAPWKKLLCAILANDREKVARLLADDPSLARRTEDVGDFGEVIALEIAEAAT